MKPLISAQDLDLVQHLPPAPTVLVELLDLFKDEDRDLDRAIELINHDPALTSEILKCCNSSYFGARQRVGDMFEAVSMLGFYEVYRIVVAMVGSQVAGLTVATTALDISALWEHSVWSAEAAGIIARHTGEDQSLAFTAGLLHDVGKVVLAAARPELYERISMLIGEVLTEREEEAFGVNHAAVGAQIFARWALPTSVIAAVGQHHALDEGHPFPELAAAVHVADVIAHRLVSGPECGVVEKPEFMEILRLTPDNLTGLMEQVAERADSVKQLIGAMAPA